MVRYLSESDANKIIRIYQDGLDSGQASFEIEAPDWSEWNRKYLPIGRLGWQQDQQLLGWAALAPVSARSCYRGVAEVSLYVDPAYQGLGIGSKLLGRLIVESENNEIWTLYSSIFAENSATRRLHLRHGFREVGIRERIAQHRGRWRDTLILERRSTQVGL